VILVKSEAAFDHLNDQKPFKLYCSTHTSNTLHAHLGAAGGVRGMADIDERLSKPVKSATKTRQGQYFSGAGFQPDELLLLKLSSDCLLPGQDGDSSKKLIKLQGGRQVWFQSPGSLAIRTFLESVDFKEAMENIQDV
jgi:hypothetical protein